MAIGKPMIDGERDRESSNREERLRRDFCEREVREVVPADQLFLKPKIIH